VLVFTLICSGFHACLYAQEGALQRVRERMQTLKIIFYFIIFLSEGNKNYIIYLFYFILYETFKLIKKIFSPYNSDLIYCIHNMNDKHAKKLLFYK